MKKELIAAALLLLLIGAAALNIQRINRLNADVSSWLQLSEKHVSKEDYDRAAEYLEKARTAWRNEKNYTHVFLRQPELDTVEDIFFELKEHISQKEKESLPALFSKLRYHLNSLCSMECPTMGSVF